ncbi:LOW QUALITY PROTEIN: HHIP-like protein 2 [Acridotheres tristis]
MLQKISIQDFCTSGLKKPVLKEVNAWPQAGKSSSSSGVSFPCPRVVCLSLLCLTGTLLGHPQCLGYGPPFQPPLPLEFCSAYENFGCCDQERDNSIAVKYWDIMDMDPQGYELCGTYIKDILCQVGRKNNICILHFGLVCGSDSCAAVKGRVEAGEEWAGKGMELNPQQVFCKVLCVRCITGIWEYIMTFASNEGLWKYCPMEEPFLDIQSIVLATLWLGDEGFLGMAFHPKHKDNGKFYIYYSYMAKMSGKESIGEFKVFASDANKADPSSERNLLDLEEPAANHNCGQVLCFSSEAKYDILPIFAYGHNVGKSVTGGFVYRGCDSPSLNGLYIFGDFMSGRLMALQEDEKTNKWKKQDICIGSTTVCAFPGIISSYSKLIISFAVDEAVRYHAGHTFNGNCSLFSTVGKFSGCFFGTNKFLKIYIYIQRKATFWRAREVSPDGAVSFLPCAVCTLQACPGCAELLGDSGLFPDLSPLHFPAVYRIFPGDSWLLCWAQPQAVNPAFPVSCPHGRKCTGKDSKPDKLLLPKHCQGHCHVPDGNSDFPRNLPADPLVGNREHRRTPPGMKIQPIPEKTKSKQIPFVPRASKLAGFDFNEKQNIYINLQACD